MVKKRFALLLIVCVIVIWAATGVFRFHYQQSKCSRIDFSDYSTSANIGDAVQGSYVLYSKSARITDFPYVFGEKTMLYDVSNDKEWVVSHTWHPYGVEGLDIAFQGDCIYMAASEWTLSDVINLKHVSLKSGRAMIIKHSWAPRAYALHDGLLYYVTGHMDGDEKSELCTLKQGESVGRRMFDDYISGMAIFGDTLYWANPRTKEVHLRNLRTDKERVYSDIFNDATVFQEIDSDRFAVFYESGCVNLFENGKVRKLCTTKQPFYWDDYVTYCDRFLYFCLAKEKICKIDINTGKVSTLFDLKRDDPRYSKQDLIRSISYSDKNIFFTVRDKRGKNTRMLILDHCGKVLKYRED